MNALLLLKLKVPSPKPDSEIERRKDVRTEMYALTKRCTYPPKQPNFC